MAPQPAPASSGGTPGTEPVPPARRVPYGGAVIVLVDWWLKRVEGEEARICVAGFTCTPQPLKGASASRGNRRGEAGRLVTSAAIARRLDSTTLETVDGKLIRIERVLNSSRTRENGFSDEVCESFEAGFPVGWEKIANRNMEQMGEHAPANAPSASVEYYMKRLLSGSFADAMRYAYGGNDLYSLRGSTSNTDGRPIQRCCNVSNGNTGNHPGSLSKMAASMGLGNARMDIPEEPLAPPGETCNSGQADDQHESMQLNTSGQETGSFKQSTGYICSDSKLDGNRSASSKIASVEKESYRSRAGCDLAEQDAYIQHEGMHSCSSEQQTATHPVDSTLVHNYMSCTSPDLGEREAPNCGKTSVNRGIVDAVEAPVEGVTPQFGADQGLKDSTVRRLRSGKVFGTPCSAPGGRGNKRKRIQHEASNKKNGTKCKGRTNCRSDFS